MRLRTFSLFFAFAVGVSTLYGQNIFDDANVDAAKPEKTPGNPEKSAEKSVAKKQRKHRKKKKKSKIKPSTSNSKYESAAMARNSYAWAPESGGIRLSSSAPGIKQHETHAPAVVTANQTIRERADLPKKDSETEKNAPFKLPEISLPQLLIVAGFVILFLIYRFRVSKQIKRKKY